MKCQNSFSSIQHNLLLTFSRFFHSTFCFLTSTSSVLNLFFNSILCSYNCYKLKVKKSLSLELYIDGPNLIILTTMHCCAFLADNFVSNTIFKKLLIFLAFIWLKKVKKVDMLIVRKLTKVK